MKREIIIEVERTRVIYGRRNKSLKWCPFCRSEVEILTLEEALEISRLDAETMYERLARGRIHFYQTAKGKPRVCLNSLLENGNHFLRTDLVNI